MTADAESGAMAPGVHRLRLTRTVGEAAHHVNAYLLGAKEDYVLVDCGWSSDQTHGQLEQQLQAAAAIPISALRAIVVTHYHSDHYGMVARLRRLTAAPILLSRADWQCLERFQLDSSSIAEASRRWLESNGLEPGGPAGTVDAVRDAANLQIVAPDRYLDGSDEFRVGTSVWQVIPTPGHTPGHVCLYEPLSGLLLSGDHILSRISPNIAFWPPDAVDPLGDYLRSLAKIAELRVRLVLPAHGEPFIDANSRIEALLQHHAERAGEVLAALRMSGPASATAVARRLPWTRRRQALDELTPQQQRSAILETLSHLEHLATNGQIVRAPTDVRLYSAGG